ncbi:hypothetical protein [Arthrobacter sp. HMWF013]|uniref:hypothetical protein n=1 Tax=Arthrobacter sp. HMWF013 TaxID=2056849 RepID=UPI000D3725DF|nr:hypothetical protein [Arthrobacter sp. HMWF013]PTT60163.1 hypothetical protein DBR22_20925 [Arthrobacter sp. HMWF013]
MTTDYYDGLPAVTAGDGSPYSPSLREISVRIRDLMVLLDECLIGSAQTSEDLSALAWISQSLEDIEATVTGLTHGEYQQLTDDRSPAVPVYQLTEQGSVLIS